MSARRLPVGSRPRPGVPAVPVGAVSLADIDAVAHRPAGEPAGVVALTHGAGGDRDAPLLTRVCTAWAACGWLAIRYNLPFRRRRPSGPPSGDRKSTRLNSSHVAISYAVFCLQNKTHNV